MEHTDTPIVEEPPETATASVIWLHGLGADGYDFVPVIPDLGPITACTRFVFPHAPMRPVSINDGFVMRAWYDIVEQHGRLVSDEAGLRESQRTLEALVAAERRAGIPARRIVLAGFSQGGAVALHTALRHPERLAGLLALSTYLPLAESVQSERHPANEDLPVFMAHGERDPMIPLARAEQSRDALLSLGYRIDWRSYRMEHAVSPREIADIAAWLAAVLAPESK